ncbi:MAG TPA: tetratricopeptide repeat protein [Gemmataceae bacterium]|nr:tetratricopeptide repeat protein [Gemmataceae bacterium]
MATISEALAVALEHHQGGRLQAAEQIYRQILEVEPNHPDALHLLGVIASAVGQLETAVQYMERSLELRPDNAGAHYNLGNAFIKLGKIDEAVACYRRVLQLKPDYGEAHANLGFALRDQGNLDEAVLCYRRALALKPDFAEAHNNLGIALMDQGKLDEAVACYRRALDLKPAFAEAYNNLGVALKDQVKPDEAVDCYQRALQLKPDYAEAYCNLGVALSEQGKLDEAVACYRQALALKPDYPEAQNNLGYVLMGQGKLDEAIACYQQALALKPDFAEAHNNLGIALKDQGKLDEAVASYRAALTLKPDFAEGHNNLGDALRRQGNLDAAVAHFRQALALKPDFADAHWNQSLLMLLRGDFEHGWAEYEWRSKIKRQDFQRRQFAEPLWDSQPLAGRTILLHSEQGLGDTIQFIRYAPLVKDCGGRVVVECQRPLLPLLAGCSGIDQLFAQGDTLPAFDVQAPLLSLPWILGTTFDTIPARGPYLRAEPERAQSWRKKLEPLGGFKVGIVWQGNPTHTSDHYRSFPLAQLATLARVEGVRLISLQKGPGTDELQRRPQAIVDLGDRLDRDGAFLDTAAIMMSLDLVVGVDSAVAHLAGALGIPVWLPLALIPDWRWLLERADCPWYPHHRLFRQSRPGDWSEVFERIAAALRGLVATRTGG